MTCCYPGKSIGMPWGAEEEREREDVNNAKTTPSQIVDKQANNGETYMQRLTGHFKDKMITPEEARRTSNERYDPASPSAGLLEGNHATGKNCCVRKDEMGGSAVGVGVRCTTYECCETYSGECKWRTAKEPSLICMYMSENRVVLHEGDKHDMALLPPKSLLVPCCMNKDAQAEADNSIVQKGRL